jgi:hypothetical protein
MYLITLVIIFGLLGYVIATSRLGNKVDRTAGKVSATYQIEDRWKGLFRRRISPNAFRVWAAGPGKSLLPEDFRKWLNGLSEQEAQEFAQALDLYANSLGFKLDDLVQGGLDQDPIMRQVFVEAIVVYSPAYRKARQAKQQSSAATKDKAASTTPQDGKGSNSAEPHHRSSPSSETGEVAQAA